MSSIKGLFLLRGFLAITVLLLPLSCVYAYVTTNEVWVEAHRTGTTKKKDKLILSEFSGEQGYNDTNYTVIKAGFHFFKTIIDVGTSEFTFGALKLTGQEEDTNITAAGPVLGYEVMVGNFIELTFKLDASYLHQVNITGKNDEGEEVHTRTTGSITSYMYAIGIGQANKRKFHFYVGTIVENIFIDEIGSQNDIESHVIGVGYRF
jgi:hypothetical protein